MLEEVHARFGKALARETAADPTKGSAAVGAKSYSLSRSVMGTHGDSSVR